MNRRHKKFGGLINWRRVRGSVIDGNGDVETGNLKAKVEETEATVKVSVKLEG